jgi:hypothetical protein
MNAMHSESFQWFDGIKWTTSRGDECKKTFNCNQRKNAVFSLYWTDATVFNIKTDDNFVVFKLCLIVFTDLAKTAGQFVLRLPVYLNLHQTVVASEQMYLASCSSDSSLGVTLVHIVCSIHVCKLAALTYFLPEWNPVKMCKLKRTDPDAVASNWFAASLLIKISTHLTSRLVF